MRTSRNEKRVLLTFRDSLSGAVAKVRPHLASGLTLGAARLLPIFVGLISFPLLTRLLGPSQYGQLSLINSLVGLISVVAGSWIALAVHRYYANDVRDHGQVSVDRWIFFRALPVSAALAIAGLAVLFLIYPVDIVLVLAAFVLVSSQMVYSAAISMYHAMLRFRASLLVELAKAVGYIGLLILLVPGLGFGVAGAVWAAALSGVVALAFLFGRKEVKTNRSDPGPGYLKKFVSYGMPMTVSSVGTWILQLSDRWFLASYHGDAAVGTYAANYSLIEYIVRYPIQIILLLLSLQLFRMESAEGSLARFRAVRPYVLVAIGAVVGAAIVVGTPLLKLLASPAYLQPGNLQVILAIAQGVQVVAMYEGIRLQLLHRTVIVMGATLVAALLNLLLNAFFVPPYGAQGAAIATMLSYVALTAIVLVGGGVMASSQTRPEKGK